MAISITEDHRELADVISAFAARRDVRASARALLDDSAHDLSGLWEEVAQLGWLGIHLPEQYGGSGYGLEELVVVVEEFGRAILPGPFLPTVITSAIVADLAPTEIKDQMLAALCDGVVEEPLG